MHTASPGSRTLLLPAPSCSRHLDDGGEGGIVVHVMACCQGTLASQLCDLSLHIAAQLRHKLEAAGFALRRCRLQSVRLCQREPCLRCTRSVWRVSWRHFGDSGGASVSTRCLVPSAAVCTHKTDGEHRRRGVFVEDIAQQLLPSDSRHAAGSGGRHCAGASASAYENGQMSVFVIPSLVVDWRRRCAYSRTD